MIQHHGPAGLQWHLMREQHRTRLQRRSSPIRDIRKDGYNTCNSKRPAPHLRGRRRVRNPEDRFREPALLPYEDANVSLIFCGIHATADLEIHGSH